MKNQFLNITFLTSSIIIAACGNSNSQTTPAVTVKTGAGNTISLPAADTQASKTNFSKVEAKQNKRKKSYQL